jgi:predicted GIY-YIG superfamily endonuclease
MKKVLTRTKRCVKLVPQEQNSTKQSAVRQESEVTSMSTKEKEAILNDISKMKPEDKAFVLGYCAGRAADAQEEDQDQE